MGKKREPANKGNYSVIVCPHCGLTLRPGTQKESVLYCPMGRMYRENPCSRVRMKKALAEDTLVRLVRKQALDIRRQEVSAAVSEAEAREAVEESGKREYREALRIREYLHLEGYDKRVMASLIESAKVIGEDRLEVVWIFGDVYEKILGEMR